MKTIYLFAICLLLASCASPYLTDSISVSDGQDPFQNILIFADSKDQVSKIMFERQVKSEMIAIQKGSVTSGEVSLDADDPEVIARSLQSQGVDGVIVTTLLSEDNYEKVIPGTPGTYYYPRRFGRYWGAYPMSDWSPDRVVSGKVYSFQSALYDLRKKEDNLIWVGKFQVKDPSNIEKIINKVAVELVDAMKDKL